MTVKELADGFGLSIAELSNLMGYSRQGTYNLMSGQNVQRSHFEAAVKALKAESDKIYRKDVQAAEARAVERESLISELEETAEIEEDHDEPAEKFEKRALIHALHSLKFTGWKPFDMDEYIAAYREKPRRWKPKAVQNKAEKIKLLRSHGMTAEQIMERMSHDAGRDTRMHGGR